MIDQLNEKILFFENQVRQLTETIKKQEEQKNKIN